MTVLYRDPVFLEHQTGSHPESPQRLIAIEQTLSAGGFLDRCSQGTFQPLSDNALRLVHRPEQIERVRSLAASGGGFIDADTVVSPRSFEVAKFAAGATVEAVRFVVEHGGNAFCAVRPPGHHADGRRSMGFCLFNNIALAAATAREALGLERILIVDFDVHHGNGTQDIFYADGRVTFFSIHRFGSGFYPGTGAADEIGIGEGKGKTINVPIPYGTPRDEYLSAFRAHLERAADISQPQLVLVSAGFDAHRRDPIGSLGLETGDFVSIAEQIVAVANTWCGGRLVAALEGGYDLQALSEGVAAFVQVLLDAGDNGSRSKTEPA